MHAPENTITGLAIVMIPELQIINRFLKTTY